MSFRGHDEFLLLDPPPRKLLCHTILILAKRLAAGLKAGEIRCGMPFDEVQKLAEPLRQESETVHDYVLQGLNYIEYSMAPEWIDAWADYTAVMLCASRKLSLEEMHTLLVAKRLFTPVQRMELDAFDTIVCNEITNECPEHYDVKAQLSRLFAPYDGTGEFLAQSGHNVN